MIRLSDRLQRIAEEVREGETMADIGTDHGFLPVFLVESGRCQKVIMADVSPFSLEKARGTARQQGFMKEGETGLQQKSSMDFRVGDGLSVLEPYEVETVVIAGMGGKLIRDILAENMKLTCSFQKFVLQPRIGQGHLRKWLINHGFMIVREGLVHEGRHIPEIITALNRNTLSEGRSVTTPAENLMKRAEGAFPVFSQEMMELDGDDIRWKIPPWMIYADGPVDAFLSRNMAAEEEKLENVRRARRRDLELEACILHNIDYLKTLRKEYDNGKQQRFYSK